MLQMVNNVQPEAISLPHTTTTRTRNFALLQQQDTRRVRQGSAECGGMTDPNPGMKIVRDGTSDRYS